MNWLHGYEYLRSPRPGDEALEHLTKQFKECFDEAYESGLLKAMALIGEQREAEGGEACCALREVVALDNAMHRIDKHLQAVIIQRSE